MPVDEERKKRYAARALERRRERIAQETPEQRALRREKQRQARVLRRSLMTPEDLEIERVVDRVKKAIRKEKTRIGEG